jgi:thiol:disulfide interchange protein DsbD
MKKVLFIGIGAFLTLGALAQNSPVHFAYRAEKIDAKTYAIHIVANIEDGWHIYSQTQPKEAVAHPTQIAFTKNPLFTWGKLTETGNKEKYEDKVADIIQYQYGGTVEFVQTVTLKAPVKSTLTGSITYQACTEERCLSPKTEPFSVTIE